MTEISAEFEALMDALFVPAFIVDVRGGDQFILRGVNAHHSSITGTRNRDIRGRNVSEVLPARIADIVTMNCRRCVESGTPHKYEELLDHEASDIWWLTTLSPTTDEQGNVVAIIGLALDITEFKQKQLEALDSVVEARKLNEEVGAFTGLAAHDLRGPLRQIRLVTEIIEDSFDEPEDEKAELLTIIKDVADGALEKVDQVLEHARGFSGEPETRMPVDFGQLCADIVVLLDPLSRFDIVYPRLWINAETVGLQVQLRNILDNALKNAESRVTIEVAPAATGAGQLKICVSDDGPGFADPQTAIQSIMSSPADKDTGYGLSTVARLVASRGGQLWIAEPDLGQGATVCWTINAEQVEAPSDHKPVADA